MFVPNELMNVKYEKSNINEPRSINLFKKKNRLHILNKNHHMFYLIKIRKKKMSISSIKFR